MLNENYHLLNSLTVNSQNLPYLSDSKGYTNTYTGAEGLSEYLFSNFSKESFIPSYQQSLFTNILSSSHSQLQETTFLSKPKKTTKYEKNINQIKNAYKSRTGRNSFIESLIKKENKKIEKFEESAAKIKNYEPKNINSHENRFISREKSSKSVPLLDKEIKENLKNKKNEYFNILKPENKIVENVKKLNSLYQKMGEKEKKPLESYDLDQNQSNKKLPTIQKPLMNVTEHYFQPNINKSKKKEKNNKNTEKKDILPTIIKKKVLKTNPSSILQRTKEIISNFQSNEMNEEEIKKSSNLDKIEENENNENFNIIEKKLTKTNSENIDFDKQFNTKNNFEVIEKTVSIHEIDENLLKNNLNSDNLITETIKLEALDGNIVKKPRKRLEFVEKTIEITREKISNNTNNIENIPIESNKSIHQTDEQIENNPDEKMLTSIERIRLEIMQENQKEDNQNHEKLNSNSKNILEKQEEENKGIKNNDQVIQNIIEIKQDQEINFSSTFNNQINDNETPILFEHNDEFKNNDENLYSETHDKNLILIDDLDLYSPKQKTLKIPVNIQDNKFSFSLPSDKTESFDEIQSPIASSQNSPNFKKPNLDPKSLNNPFHKLSLFPISENNLKNIEDENKEEVELLKNNSDNQINIPKINNSSDEIQIDSNKILINSRSVNSLRKQDSMRRSTMLYSEINKISSLTTERRRSVVPQTIKEKIENNNTKNQSDSSKSDSDNENEENEIEELNKNNLVQINTHYRATKEFFQPIFSKTDKKNEENNNRKLARIGTFKGKNNNFNILDQIEVENFNDVNLKFDFKKKENKKINKINSDELLISNCIKIKDNDDKLEKKRIKLMKTLNEFYESKRSNIINIQNTIKKSLRINIEKDNLNDLEKTENIDKNIVKNDPLESFSHQTLNSDLTSSNKMLYNISIIPPTEKTIENSTIKENEKLDLSKNNDSETSEIFDGQEDLNSLLDDFEKRIKMVDGLRKKKNEKLSFQIYVMILRELCLIKENYLDEISLNLKAKKIDENPFIKTFTFQKIEINELFPFEIVSFNFDSSDLLKPLENRKKSSEFEEESSFDGSPTVDQIFLNDNEQFENEEILQFKCEGKSLNLEYITIKENKVLSARKDLASYIVPIVSRINDEMKNGLLQTRLMLNNTIGLETMDHENKEIKKNYKNFKMTLKNSDEIEQYKLEYFSNNIHNLMGVFEDEISIPLPKSTKTTISPLLFQRKKSLKPHIPLPDFETPKKLKNINKINKQKEPSSAMPLFEIKDHSILKKIKDKDPSPSNKFNWKIINEKNDSKEVTPSNSNRTPMHKKKNIIDKLENMKDPSPSNKNLTWKILTEGKEPSLDYQPKLKREKSNRNIKTQFSDLKNKLGSLPAIDNGSKSPPKVNIKINGEDTPPSPNYSLQLPDKNKPTSPLIKWKMRSSKNVSAFLKSKENEENVEKDELQAQNSKGVPVLKRQHTNRDLFSAVKAIQTLKKNSEVFQKNDVKNKSKILGDKNTDNSNETMEKNSMFLRSQIKSVEKLKGLDPLQQMLWAISHNKLQNIEEILISFPGLYIDTRDENGNTFLMLASQIGNIDIINLFLAKGANINVTNNEGNTALHISLAFMNDLIADKLIFAGASEGCKNNEGKTPWDMYSKR